MDRKIRNILCKAWSIESSSKWSKDNPAKGQCGVTALVINDLFGGDILKTKTDGGWHFYNLINGERCDYTESQFTKPVQYLDAVSSRQEAFADTNENQYMYLKQKVNLLLSSYK
ncbi:YunG family protein [Bacillus gobiensis]|uniref:YunG family protein n=1 Tax=Bacillus gobiensis TaxID=1441095 RepID=UPI003D19B211